MMVANQLKNQDKRYDFFKDPRLERKGEFIYI